MSTPSLYRSTWITTIRWLRRVGITESVDLGKKFKDLEGQALNCELHRFFIGTWL
ncbi:hypothetical protein OQJ26_10130 [Legionella sp. PATHC038]|uniref:hypothetical protein n=1 Tax=Legionella sheltonii TaxID=2992041 RepID=UPI0022447ED8|nr:hypothetical protein [Legionella sp. PATHC038]MCW8399149.1 hypothetical protein [Legionella sp. PATHC038]